LKSTSTNVIGDDSVPSVEGSSKASSPTEPEKETENHGSNNSRFLVSYSTRRPSAGETEDEELGKGGGSIGDDDIEKGVKYIKSIECDRVIVATGSARYVSTFKGDSLAAWLPSYSH
jgi:hypothetical protein